MTDGDSVTINNMRDSANGTFVTLDDYLLLTDTVERVVDVPVPEMVEQLVKLPKTVCEDGLQERTMEQTVDILVPRDVEEPAKFFKASSLDRVQQSSAEQTIETLAFFVGKIFEVPVIQTQRKTQQGVNAHVQHAVVTVEVETHHPGEHQPGDQAHRSSAAAVHRQGR